MAKWHSLETAEQTKRSRPSDSVGAVEGFFLRVLATHASKFQCGVSDSQSGAEGVTVLPGHDNRGVAIELWKPHDEENTLRSRLMVTVTEGYPPRIILNRNLETVVDGEIYEHAFESYDTATVRADNQLGLWNVAKLLRDTAALQVQFGVRQG